jgi:K+-sensing histidine kinase KdpD
MTSVKMARPTRHDGRKKRWFALLGRADALVGAIICGMSAAAASVIADGYSWRVCVPLVFTVVLLVVALIFGARAGIAGTAIAALIFSTMLFNPLGRVQVSDPAARSNLGWMLLIGLSFSLLFAPPTSGLRRH